MSASSTHQRSVSRSHTAAIISRTVVMMLLNTSNISNISKKQTIMSPGNSCENFSDRSVLHRQRASGCHCFVHGHPSVDAVLSEAEHMIQSDDRQCVAPMLTQSYRNRAQKTAPEITRQPNHPIANLTRCSGGERLRTRETHRYIGWRASPRGAITQTLQNRQRSFQANARARRSPVLDVVLADGSRDDLDHRVCQSVIECTSFMKLA